MKLATFSAKMVANFRRSLEVVVRASFAGENRQKQFPPKLHRKFHHKLYYEVLGCGGPYKMPCQKAENVRNFYQKLKRPEVITANDLSGTKTLRFIKR